MAAAKRVLDWLKKSPSASGRSAAAGPHLVYVDEGEIHSPSPSGTGPAQEGQPMRLPAVGADQKGVIFGALDYSSGRILHTVSARKGEDVFTTFLEQLLQTFLSDEAFVVVLDNAGYHKSLAVREWWRAHAAQLHLSLGRRPLA